MSNIGNGLNERKKLKLNQDKIEVFLFSRKAALSLDALVSVAKSPFVQQNVHRENKKQNPKNRKQRLWHLKD